MPEKNHMSVMTIPAMPWASVVHIAVKLTINAKPLLTSIPRNRLVTNSVAVSPSGGNAILKTAQESRNRGTPRNRT